MKNKIPYYQPSYKELAFNCPFCNAYSSQTWYDDLYIKNLFGFESLKKLGRKIELCRCDYCEGISIWYNSEMIYPDFSGIEPPDNEPNDYLSLNIQDDYLEAASILNKSPRGAAAVLQSALRKLIRQLNEKENGLKNDKVKKALDAIKSISDDVINSDELHKSDVYNNKEKVKDLFKLFNYIAERIWQ